MDVTTREVMIPMMLIKATAAEEAYMPGCGAAAYTHLQSSNLGLRLDRVPLIVRALWAAAAAEAGQCTTILE